MLLGVLTLVIIPLGLVSLITYYQARKILVEQIYTTLNVTSDSLRRELTLFLESKEKRAREVVSYRFLREILRKVNKHPERPDLIAELNRYLAIEKAPLDPDIYDILVFNKEGKLISSTHKELKGIKIDNEYFSKARQGVTFKSVENINGERLFDVSAPIIDTEKGEFLGVAAVRFKASAIDNILIDGARRLWGAATVGDESEWRRIIVVDQNKIIIASASAFFLGRPVDIEPVNRAFGSRLEMTGEFVGILGKDRLGASLLFEEVGWVLVASVSKKEILSPVMKYLHIGFLRIGIGVIAVIILTLLIAKRIAKPILDISDTADRIAKGHWDERVIVKDKKGEIARLANAFNEMVEKLQNSFHAIGHSERLKENIISTIPSGLLVLNNAFEVLSVNKSFCKMFDVTLHEVMGKPIDKVLAAIGISREGRNAIAHKDCFSDFKCDCDSPKKGKMILKLSLTKVEESEEVILLFDNISGLSLSGPNGLHSQQAGALTG